MGFEILAIVPCLKENAKTEAEKTRLKTRVARIATIGPNYQDHTTAFILMECLEYEIGERCPKALEPMVNDDGDEEYEFEGCGEVVEYTAEELVAAARRVEESSNEESQKKAVLKFLDKTIEALDLGGWDKAEIGFF